jgi:phosphatidylserine/phosphatidylglycerophosphate/cardiolipin synthase-like enzyme
MRNLSILFVFLAASIGLASILEHSLFYPGSLAILPQDGRQIFFEAFAAAEHEIRIEICVLEDPLILQSLQQAIKRGVRARALVDRRKYENLPSEQHNLAQYFSSVGGELHLSNPIFPRSFPKVVLIDNRSVLVGTACLDSETFAQYRDYVHVVDDRRTINYLSNLFENDWLFSAPVGLPTLPFNPTPPLTDSRLIISPVNASSTLVSFIQNAHETLDLTSEILGNETLESELIAAAQRGVKVRLISPQFVNNATPAEQAIQIAALNKLKQFNIDVHVTLPPETSFYPYMHARTAIADHSCVYLGSISLSWDSITFNREVGLFIDDRHVVSKLENRFNLDFNFKSRAY